MIWYANSAVGKDTYGFVSEMVWFSRIQWILPVASHIGQGPASGFPKWEYGSPIIRSPVRKFSWEYHL